MNFNRGSEWRKWDLHVHTPYSYLNNQFGDDFDEYVKTLFLNAITHQIAVIGITDYFSIEGYKKIKNEYLNNYEKLKSLFIEEQIRQIQTIKILPNIEFRLNKIIGTNRVNFHVIFSDDVSITDIEENFLHELEFIYEGNPQGSDEKWKLKIPNIKELGKKLIEEQPELGSSELFVGLKCAVVDDTQILDILKNKQSKFKDKYLIVVPSDEDLSVINWKSQDHNVRKVILQKADMLFASNPKTIKWGLGEFNETEEDYIKEFKSIKVCIWGSDAHGYENLFIPANNRFTWIKANPNFVGLKQVVNEPRERVFLGENPPKRQTVLLNKSKYISKVKITKTSASRLSDLWFDNELDINPGLVAIIGNKGNGKSALADIIALTGNAQLINHTDYVFLTKEKFRRNGLAKNFEATLLWEDKDQSTVNLDETFKIDEIERVKYLPQKYIETICTSENYEDFQDEINKVVFSHIDEEEKLGKQNLSKLISEKTDAVKERRERLGENIKNLFDSLIALRTDYSDLEMKKVENALREKNKEIDEHEEYKNENIIEVKKPEDDEQVQDEQKKQFKKITRLNKHALTLESFKEKLQNQLKEYVVQKNILENTLQSLKQEVESFKERLQEVNQKFFEAKIEMDIDQMVTLSFDTSLIDSKIETITKTIGARKVKIAVVDQMLEKKKVDIDGLTNALSEVQQAYQKYVEQMQQWEAKKREFIAQKNRIEERIIFKKEKLPAKVFKIKRDLLQAYFQLHDTYKQELAIYEELYKPVLQFIEDEKKKTNATKGFIEFTTNLVFKKKEFTSKLLDFFDNRRKRFDDKDVIELIDEHNLFDAKSMRRLLQRIENIINDKKPIEQQFRDYKKTLDFYVVLWDMSYVAIEYDIKLDGKTVSQLSPGERGALLIIFYLLIDKGDIPLIIDQPEDNLDNESVFEYLVPYIKRAKQRRQIIIVTHNPNIAVVSDAEQIIYSKIDKANKNEVSYVLGAIEAKEINEKIVEVLEGTFPAFDNRTRKYYRTVNV
ncbi:hypothetical protein WCX18_07650 [Sulfurimonas sp. HSL1-2]|uniref:TrlF family AAA-like ATPase n=1 Tax=Thiomicrolovo zhangzhouensis TaxID=3131933 RepID=UPI0031F735C9